MSVFGSSTASLRLLPSRRPAVIRLVLVVLAAAASLVAESSAQVADPARRIVVEDPHTLAQRLRARDVRRQARLREFTRRYGPTGSGGVDMLTYSLKQAPGDSSAAGPPVYSLMRLQKNRPVFRITHNLAAGFASHVPELREGGWVGVDLRGKGSAIGLWDAGTPHVTHDEFGVRVQVLDESTMTAGHATHVAGTLAARGVRVEAEGVAPEATVRARDWQNDESEMATAGAEGLLLSNHSYGTLGGWVRDLRGTGRWSWMGDPSLAPSEDQRFGYYGDEAATWDAIAAASPNYVMVKSAGNERADTGPVFGEPHDVFADGWTVSYAHREADGGDDGYDSILDAGLAKNVITVGAVEDMQGPYRGASDVRMTSFSSWGPADDGRIKPDLVANGASVLSPVAGWDQAYAYSSGTSMAAPVVAGVVSLLQSVYRSRLGHEPGSSMVRALLVHSADEAGPELGPDYQFGWGLTNAAGAVALVLDEATSPGRLVSGALEPGGSASFEFEVAAGGVVAATLAWTDPPALPGPSVLNSRQPALVNDLDLVVDGPDGTVRPFILNPDLPNAAAKRGTNTVDTVEQVKLPSATGGTYRAILTLDATAVGPQAFALVLGQTRSGSRRTGWVSGRLVLGEAGLENVPVQANGQTRVSVADGSFLFSKLPSGPVAVVPDPAFGFEPDTAWVDPSNPTHLVFTARNGAWLESYDAFWSPDLLTEREGESRSEVALLAAGGVYGLDVILNTTRGLNLSGARLAIDFEAAPATRSYIGAQAARFMSLDPFWRLSEIGPGVYAKRVPAFWIAANSPPGTVELPLEVFDLQDRVVARDTVAFLVGGPDDLPPILYHQLDVEGRGLAVDGQEVVLRTHVVDGSAIDNVKAFLFERGSNNLITSLDMYDDGVWARHGDAALGDRLFGAVYRPDRENDYRVDFRASDAHANTSSLTAAWHFSSKPFAVEAPYLLATWSQSDTDTDAHSQALALAGVGHDVWEFDIRSQVPDSVLNAYRGVVWSWDDRVIDRQEDIQQITRLVSENRPLVLLGSTLGLWISEAAGISPSGRYAVTEAVGATVDPVWRGFSASVSSTALALSGGEPLLRSGDLTVAAQNGSLVVSGLALPEMPSPMQADYLRLLLFSATGDAGLSETPTSTTSTTSLKFAVREPYPNPASIRVRVDFSLAVPGNVDVSVHDIVGRRVIRLDLRPFQSGAHQLSLPVGHLSSGVYFVTLTSGSDRQTHPVLVVSGDHP